MFIIVRHGNTFEAGTAPRRIGARTDLPLTEAGQVQADALGELFARKGMNFKRVLSGTLLRTRQTAKAILARQASPPKLELHDFLAEVDYGPDENKPEEEVIARIGEASISAWDERAAVPLGWNVEPSQRIAAWRSFFSSEQFSKGPILLVTSNGAARFALLADPALAEGALKVGSLKLPTGGYGIIERGTHGGLTLAAWGGRP